MSTAYAHSLRRWSMKTLVAFMIALCIVFLALATILASAVDIHDDAGVLNKSQVTRAASSLAYPMSIYTANYAGSNDQFDRTARSKVNRADLIVMAINTRGHVYTTGGTDVSLTVSQYTGAAQAFASDYGRTQNFTSATVASIRTFQTMVGGGRHARTKDVPAGGLLPGPARGGGPGPAAFCCIGVLLLIALAFFVVMRRRSGMGNLFNRSGAQPFGSRTTQPFNQPPGDYPPGEYPSGNNPPGNYPPGNYPPGNYPPGNNPPGNYPPGNYPPGNNPPGNYPPGNNPSGNYPPNAGPGYPPAQQPRRGLNPWAAGGLGAAAGGLFGYGLGKEHGERSERDAAGQQGDGGGAGFGNDAGGGGADFGNSGGGFDNNNGGGGADFGNSGGGFDKDNGGGSADFGGGGGDFGSDSGGADFGNDQDPNSGGGSSDF